jgi:L-arabinose isomerase
MIDRKYRIGLATVYFKLFDEVMPPTYRASKEAFVQAFIDKLSPHVEVIYTELIDDDAKGERTREVFIQKQVDLILLAPAMAAPPSYGYKVVENTDVPIIIWSVPTVDQFMEDLSQVEATKHSTFIGSIMLGNALVREGIVFQTVNAALDNQEGCNRLIRMILAACAAQRMKKTRFVRMGGIIPGYLDVDVSQHDFQKGLGAELVDMDHVQLNAAFQSVTDHETHTFVEELKQSNWKINDIAPDMLDRSARLAVALENIMKEHQFQGGAINCHGSCFRRNEQVGIVGCLGVSRLTSQGIPIACTGDVLTGAVMWIGQELAGAALYCECYAMESATGLMLLAAGGEGDTRMAEPEQDIEIRANTHYRGLLGAGAGVTFPVKKGPGTLISLSPTKTTSSGWVLTWATGEIVESRYRKMGGPNAMFKFDHSDLNKACEAWIASGATHHNALIPGRRDQEIISFATALGIDHIRITG